MLLTSENQADNTMQIKFLQLDLNADKLLAHTGTIYTFSQRIPNRWDTITEKMQI